MITLSPEVLSMTDEPAALLENRRLVYANGAAKAILGADCAGKSIRELFGDELADAQAPSFVASVPVAGENRLMRVSREGPLQIVFFSRPDPDASLLNDASLQALRSGLMNLRMAASAGQRRAEELNDPALLSGFVSLNKEYYRLSRMLSNIGVARDVIRGQLPLSLCTADLSAMISDLTDSLALLRRDVEFSFSCERRVLLWADPQLLELMLMNLLSNCLTHAVGLRRVRLALQSTQEYVYLSVRDDGGGIAPERMLGLFRRYRSPFGLNELPLGAGLGMTVILGIVERHGGSLLLESREVSGTSVRLSLSRKLNGQERLRADAAPFAGSMDRLLTGLADCLPDECFSGKYLD